MADGLGGETENLIDQENPVSPIQRQSSVTQNRDSSVPSSRVGESPALKRVAMFYDNHTIVYKHNPP